MKKRYTLLLIVLFVVVLCSGYVFYNTEFIQGKMLGRAIDKEDDKTIRKYLLSREYKLRLRALRAIMKIEEDPKKKLDLLTSLRFDKSVPVRVEAIRDITNIRHKFKIVALMSFANDNNEGVKGIAKKGITNLRVDFDLIINEDIKKLYYNESQNIYFLSPKNNTEEIILKK
ncbi:MAG: hypothetical protein E3J72_14405 [Planctomycetota bacterium]|nr:MAG: hypothetical protein E3J72_14405 [Planctomycetota bacterium]